MRKLGRVQSKLLRSLINYGSWTYYGAGNHYMAGWVYDTYKRTYDMLETLEDKGLVEREYTLTPAGTRQEVFRPLPMATKHLRRDYL